MEEIIVYNKKVSQKIKVTLSLAIFKEDKIHIAYNPSLDLSGYGKTEKEALKSFDIVLKETISYAYKNNTLSKLLASLGWWHQSGLNSIYKCSPIASKINTNDYLQNIINQNSEIKLKNNIQMVFA